jgi:hypothetical protein
MECSQMQDQGVFELAAKLARIADEHPRHIAIDAIDIAAVLLRSGRDYDLTLCHPGAQQTQSPCSESPVVV